MADEADSKSVVSDGVWVQVPPPAPRVAPLKGAFSIGCFFNRVLFGWSAIYEG